MKYFKSLILLFLVINLSSCFENVDTSSSAANGASGKDNGPVSEITDDQFSGVASALNKVTGIEISWPSATVEVLAYRVYRVKGAKLELITSVGGSVNSIIDGSVTWGAIYTYVVRAVDRNGVEEANEKRVSSLAWSGLSTVVPQSTTTIKVTFDNSSALANEIRIYIKPTIGGVKTLAGSVSPSAGQFEISSLRPGYSYQVSAQAYVDSLAKEDGNTVTFMVSTNTLGFHDNNGDTAKWRNVSSVRAFGESPGAPTHPTLPFKSPKVRTVELSFNAFTSLGMSQKYVVIRALEGIPLDTSAVETCTDTTERSCRPCGELSGSGMLFCRDTAVAASPARYRYTMAVIHEEGLESWIEPLPVDKTESMSVLVPIPPRDMVLTQRDAANYEMCVTQMNRTADPKNKNRCVYSGSGARPYNSGIDKPALNLEQGYYDFGYNLFVDRYSVGCNWTSSADGGMCGPGATPGDCVGTGANNVQVPINTIGKDGDVYWFLHYRTDAPIYYGRTFCLKKISGTWVQQYSIPTTIPNYTEALSSMITTDPSKNNHKIPPLASYNNVVSSMATCQTMNDPNYGKKRISRMREFRVWSTFPTVNGEPYSVTYTQANTLLGSRWNATDGYRCTGGRAQMNTINAPNMIPANLNELLTSPTKEIAGMNDGAKDFGWRHFILGANSSVDCMSRFGVQEPYGDQVIHTSDAVNYNTTTVQLRGIASPLDNGNRDLLIDLNGAETGYNLDATAANIIGTSPSQYRQVVLNSNTSVNYINLALGLPAYTTTSTQYFPRTSFTEHYNSSTTYPYITQASAIRYGIVGSNRWNTSLMYSLTDQLDQTKVHCVLPAN